MKILNCHSERSEESYRIHKILLLLFLFQLSACATSFDKRGVYHNVQNGDSIWRIARAYRVDLQQLAEYNNIMDPEQVQPGMKLYIPPRAKGVSFKKLPSGSTAEKKARPRKGRYAKKKNSEEGYSKSIQIYRGKFDWPIDGNASSLFGFRNGRRHDGIDIGADTGDPIHAAASGDVVFSGKMRGYGNLVLIRHEDDFFTAYAHNSKNSVRKGQPVKKGQVIGLIGRTGRATAPHLHFEIRHGQTARNPLFFLPDRDKVAMREKKRSKK